MANLFGLFGETKRKQKTGKQIMVKGELLDEEYIQYCVNQDRTLKRLEANLHTSDNPEEIAMGTLKTACDFYEGDWAGILEVDLDLGIWTPVWWHNVGTQDRTRQLMHELEVAEFMPSWIQAMDENEVIIVPDAAAVKDIRPDEYGVYQRLRVNSVIAAPFKPNPVGFLAIRNPKRYIHGLLDSRKIWRKQHFVEWITSGCTLPLARCQRYSAGVLCCIFFEEYTYEEIATMEGCTKRAVKFSVDLALQKLKEKIKKF